jgi:hypothetical protein
VQRDAPVTIFATAGSAALAKRRAEGTDPAHTDEARRKQGLHAAVNVGANYEWEKSHDINETGLDFARDILPGLQKQPLSAMMKTTGLSLRYCSIIRRGLKIPHLRHWDALRRIADRS